jgi:hypothetical protein
MREPEALPGNSCTVHRYHWPRPTRTVLHHIWPLGMGGPDASSNKVKTCDTGHYTIHGLLDWLVDNVPASAMTAVSGLAGQYVAGLLKARKVGTRREQELAALGFQRWHLAGRPRLDPGGPINYDG